MRLRGVEPGRWQHRPAGCGGDSEMPSAEQSAHGMRGRSKQVGEWCWPAALQTSVHSLVVVLLGSQTTLLLSGSPPTILLLLGRRQITPCVPELAVRGMAGLVGPFLVCRAAESFWMLQLDISS